MLDVESLVSGWFWRIRIEKPTAISFYLKRLAINMILGVSYRFCPQKGPAVQVLTFAVDHYSELCERNQEKLQTG